MPGEASSANSPAPQPTTRGSAAPGGRVSAAGGPLPRRAAASARRRLDGRLDDRRGRRGASRSRPDGRRRRRRRERRPRRRRGGGRRRPRPRRRRLHGVVRLRAGHRSRTPHRSRGHRPRWSTPSSGAGRPRFLRGRRLRDRRLRRRRRVALLHFLLPLVEELHLVLNLVHDGADVALRELQLVHHLAGDAVRAVRVRVERELHRARVSGSVADLQPQTQRLILQNAALDAEIQRPALGRRGSGSAARHPPRAPPTPRGYPCSRSSRRDRAGSSNAASHSARRQPRRRARRGFPMGTKSPRCPGDLRESRFFRAHRRAPNPRRRLGPDDAFSALGPRARRRRPAAVGEVVSDSALEPASLPPCVEPSCVEPAAAASAAAEPGPGASPFSLPCRDPSSRSPEARVAGGAASASVVLALRRRLARRARARPPVILLPLLLLVAVHHRVLLAVPPAAPPRLLHRRARGLLHEFRLEALVQEGSFMSSFAVSRFSMGRCTSE